MQPYSLLLGLVVVRSPSRVSSRFHLPSVEFINAYEGTVPDIAELASYGFGIGDITDTLRWLRTVKTLAVSPKFAGEELAEAIAQLTRIAKPRQSMASSGFDSDCLILCNVDDMEAVAAAHVLRHLVSPHTFSESNVLPKVMSSSGRLKNRPTDLSSMRPLLPGSSLISFPFCGLRSVFLSLYKSSSPELFILSHVCFWQTDLLVDPPLSGPVSSPKDDDILSHAATSCL